MHIGIITSEFPPDLGGVETYAVEFANALVALGHQVTVFVDTAHSPEFALPNLSICRVLTFCHRLDKRTLSRYPVVAWHVMNAAHSWLALASAKPVVVSIHGNDFLNPYPLTGCLGLARYQQLWRLSRILQPIDLWIGKKLTARLMRMALPKAKAILANSHYTKTVFLAKFPDCAQQTRVAQVGVGNHFLAEPLVEKHNTITQLLTVSRLSEPRKNVDRVINALSQLASTFDFCYTVIGDGAFKPQLEAQVKQLGLTDKVKFLGRQSTETVIAAMQHADLFILPSSSLPESHEGFGIVYLEAAACGTPSLATKQAGAVDAICEGHSGFFVDEPSVDAIKQALEQFLTGTIQFNSLKCRQFSTQFTWQKVVEHALPFYSGLNL